MNVFALFLYVAVIISFVLYIVFKYRKRSYIISCFNISVFIYFVSYLLIPLFYFSKLSWRALGVTNIQEYRPYLDESVIINSLGLLIMIASASFVEFGTIYKKKKAIFKLSRYSNKIYIDIAFFITITAWYWIVYTYNNQGLPLFNGGRNFYLYQSISPVYLAANELLTIFGVYYGIRFAYEKTDLVKFILSAMTVLFTGSRASIFLSLLLPVLVIALYKRKSSGTMIRSKEKKRKKKAMRKMIIVVAILGILGLSLQFVRSGIQGSTKLLSLINELLYGNTFSDFRDGAFILHGYRAQYGQTRLLGRTYLAGLLSFIPTHSSSYRQIWSWGRFTTEELFGMTGHFGLRGGNAMEAYLNFGITGVVIVSCLQGVVFGYLEKQFNYMILNEMENKIYEKYLFLFAILTLYNNLVVSSTMYNLYVDLLFLLILCSASSIAPIKIPRIRLRISRPK